MSIPLKCLSLFNSDQATTYFLVETPATDSPLVSEAQENLLRQLSISHLIDDLYNAADFMYLSFNVLARTNLWTEVSRPQKQLLRITRKSYKLIGNL